MLATYLSALIIVLASVAVGRAVARALGRRETTWTEPAVGFAVLLVAGSASIRVFDSGLATAIVLGLLLAASLAYLGPRVLSPDGLRAAAGPLLVTAAVASLPLLASQRIGILGVGINNDLAGHLLWADWLRDQSEPVPVDLASGYPIGPHSLAAALGEGLGLELTDAFVGLLIAVAALTAITALALLRDLPEPRRTIGCALVGLPYMAASSLALGGFKETTLSLILLGFVVALARLEREYPGDRATAVSLGLLAAGALAVYSYPGLYWLVAAGGLLALAGAIRALAGGEPAATLRRSAPVVAVPVLVLLVVGSTEITRGIVFRDQSGLGIAIASDSKLNEAVSPLEALGAWPDGNFLAGMEGPPLPLLFGALGTAALAVAAVWWLRRRALAVPLAVLGAGVIYAGTLLEAGLYVQAKALAVPAALVMAMIVAALLAPARAGETATPGRERSGPSPRPARRALAAAFVAVAAYSSFLALRDAVVAPVEHADELGAIRERTEGDRILFLTQDRFTDYQLRTTMAASPFLSAQTIVPARPGKDFVLPADFDSTTPEALDLFRWVLVTRAPYRSQPPPNLRLELRTESYELWRRVGPTPLGSRVLAEKGRSGKVLACGSLPDDARAALADGASATAFSRAPVIGSPEAWQPSGEPPPGGSATQTLRLPKGRWLLSLQYLSPLRGVTIEAAGESIRLPPSLDGALPGRLGPFWRVGEIRSEGEPIEVTVRIGSPSGLQRLLGVGRRATIGRIAAVAARPRERVAVEAACGRYVDHYSIPQGAIDEAAVRRARRLARASLSGSYKPPELKAVEKEAASG